MELDQLCLLGAIAWEWESKALGWMAAVMVVMTSMTVWQRRHDLRMVEKALSSGQWRPGSLSQGLYDDDPCWDVAETAQGIDETEKLADAGSSSASVWKISTMNVPLPSKQAFPVQFCNVDGYALVIRFGQHVVLSRVKSAPDVTRLTGCH